MYGVGECQNFDVRAFAPIAVGKRSAAIKRGNKDNIRMLRTGKGFQAMSDLPDDDHIGRRTEHVSDTNRTAIVRTAVPPVFNGGMRSNQLTEELVGFCFYATTITNESNLHSLKKSAGEERKGQYSRGSAFRPAP